MSVVKAKIQTVEDMYQLLWTAIANRQPVSAIYQELPRLFCPQPVGPQSAGPAARALLSVWRRERKRIRTDRVAGELALRRVREVAPRGIAECFLEDGSKSFSSSNMRHGCGY
jgi:hypothetical protein